MKDALARAALVALVALSACAACRDEEAFVVGSKKFTESVILGELATRVVAASGVPARHRSELGGTRLVWDALLSRAIDVYPEYTGTLCQEILRVPCDDTSIRRALAERHVAMTSSLGFANGYVLVARPELADRAGLSRISDLARHPALRFGFSEEFLARGDGWPALRARYHLPQRDVRGLDHDVAWRGFAQGTLDVLDAYATDAELRAYRPRMLDDDLGYFQPYHAVLLYRTAIDARAKAALERLAGTISNDAMLTMNARAVLDGVPETRVAADFLAARFGLASTVEEDGLVRRVGRRTLEHLALVGVSLAAAVLVGLPLGIVAARRRRLGHAILGLTGLLQTIPSLALLVVMIPLFGIGTAPALVALIVYSLLPIVRNTVAGLEGIAPSLRESAAAIGLSSRERLRLVELPLAMPAILAGIKTAAILDVGTATLGALVGAGGFGQPILTGIRLADTRLILEGAVPAALLALAVQAAFELLEPWIVSKGLRIHARSGGEGT